MKCKKALSFLLAFVMVLGLLPISAMAAATDGTQIGTSTNGEFVDTTADPNKSYEYTITGSDGSTQTVAVPAANAEPTGNSVTEQTNGGTYYQKVENIDPNVNTGTYLLVFQDSTANYAVKTNLDVVGVTIVDGNRINEPHSESEWDVKATYNSFFGSYLSELNFSTNGKYLLEDENHKIILSTETEYNNWAYEGQQPDTMKLKRGSWPSYYYLTANATGLSSQRNNGSTFYLYEKMSNGEPVTQYVVDTTGLDELLKQSFNQTLYTEDSWQTYADAKAAAEAAKDALKNPYTAATAADAALVAIDNATRTLDAAIKGLTEKSVDPVEPGTCVKPEITWHRTWENNSYGEKPYYQVEHIKQGDWQNISWNWTDIRHLTASDPNPWNAKNGNAATWTQGGSDWRHSAVRRFTGTFIWPAGVGMDATMTLQSVNDQDYQFIYDYIKKDPSLEERYGNAKVLPINDDMYVFISKASDGDPTGWDRETAKKHLAFWTGSSGKGIWSWKDHTGDDWGRTTPAQFLGVAATPAFHGSWPNLIDRGGFNWDVKTCNKLLDAQGNATALMEHSDAWYTLTDTNALKSKLNELYGAATDLAGEEMRIDIYAFNNDGTGGMDKLDLILCPAEPTTAQVEVKYWLDDVGATLLGSTVMTKDIGETVNLLPGTNTNELNHKKAEAINTVNNPAVNVSNGEQKEKNFEVQKSGNVINVVYTRKLQGVTYYTYDFGVQNQYAYKDTNESAIKNVRVECVTDTIGASYSGHNITLTYTPEDALGSFVQATLVVERKNSTNRYEIGLIPASNVLYEENFITNDGWKYSGTNGVQTVSDNDDNVYGHTTAYDGSTGANGEYTLALQDGVRSADELKFSFRGLGLDLIGSCGPNYGKLLVKVMKGADIIKAFVVNTQYNSRNELHQVPLLHMQDGLVAGARYDVTIRGSYQPAAKNGPAVMSAMSNDSAMTYYDYEALLDMGLTEDEIMTKVEFVNVADTLEETPVNGPMLMAQPMAATGKQTVAVDSFRIYRSTEKAKAAYAKNEQNLIYTNVMDEAINGDFSAYVESNEEGKFSTANYESKGGPENELYLNPGTGIVFQMAAAGTKTPYAQVSLRAVEGATEYNHISISSNTEMYYVVAPDENGMITISNTGSNKLAIGNLKTSSAIMSMNDETKQQAVQAVAMMFSAPETEIFTPEKFEAKVTVGTGILKRCTISITTSLDVDKLVIDGKVVKPDNQRRVNKGKDKEYVFEKSKRLRKGAEAGFEVVAYNADGVASETKLIK